MSWSTMIFVLCLLGPLLVQSIYTGQLPEKPPLHREQVIDNWYSKEQSRAVQIQIHQNYSKVFKVNSQSPQNHQDSVSFPTSAEDDTDQEIRNRFQDDNNDGRIIFPGQVVRSTKNNEADASKTFIESEKRTGQVKNDATTLKQFSGFVLNKPIFFDQEIVSRDETTVSNNNKEMKEFTGFVMNSPIYFDDDTNTLEMPLNTQGTSSSGPTTPRNHLDIRENERTNVSNNNQIHFNQNNNADIVEELSKNTLFTPDDNSNKNDNIFFEDSNEYDDHQDIGFIFPGIVSVQTSNGNSDAQTESNNLEIETQNATDLINNYPLANEPQFMVHQNANDSDMKNRNASEQNDFLYPNLFSQSSGDDLENNSSLFDINQMSINKFNSTRNGKEYNLNDTIESTSQNNSASDVRNNNDTFSIDDYFETISNSFDAIANGVQESNPISNLNTLDNATELDDIKDIEISESKIDEILQTFNVVDKNNYAEFLDSLQPKQEQEGSTLNGSSTVFSSDIYNSSESKSNDLTLNIFRQYSDLNNSITHNTKNVSYSSGIMEESIENQLNDSKEIISNENTSSEINMSVEIFNDTKFLYELEDLRDPSRNGGIDISSSNESDINASASVEVTSEGRHRERYRDGKSLYARCKILEYQLGIQKSSCRNTTEDRTLFSDEDKEYSYNFEDHSPIPSNISRDVRLMNSSGIGTDIYECPDNYTGLIPVQSDCQKFINCWKGNAYTMTCGPGTLFNHLSNLCDHFENVDCSRSKRDLSSPIYIKTKTNKHLDNITQHAPKTIKSDNLYNKSVLQAQQDKFPGTARNAKFVPPYQIESNLQNIDKEVYIGDECPPGATGQFVYAYDCRQFLNCWKGRGYIQPCSLGTLFNPETLECDHAHKVDCLHSDFSSPSTFVQQKAPESRSITAQQNAEPKCPSGSSGIFPHPTDCTKFLNCANGITYIQDCGPGTAFNPLVSVCDHPQNVGCDISKTTTSFSTQEIINREQQSSGVPLRYHVSDRRPGRPGKNLQFGSTNPQFISSNKVEYDRNYNEGGGYQGSTVQSGHQQSGYGQNFPSSHMVPPPMPNQHSGQGQLHQHTQVNYDRNQFDEYGNKNTGNYNYENRRHDRPSIYNQESFHYQHRGQPEIQNQHQGQLFPSGTSVHSHHTNIHRGGTPQDVNFHHEHHGRPEIQNQHGGQRPHSGTAVHGYHTNIHHEVEAPQDINEPSTDSFEIRRTTESRHETDGQRFQPGYHTGHPGGSSHQISSHGGSSHHIPSGSSYHSQDRDINRTPNVHNTYGSHNYGSAEDNQRPILQYGFQPDQDNQRINPYVPASHTTFHENKDNVHSGFHPSSSHHITSESNIHTVHQRPDNDNIHRGFHPSSSHHITSESNIHTVHQRPNDDFSNQGVQPISVRPSPNAYLPPPRETYHREYDGSHRYRPEDIPSSSSHYRPGHNRPQISSTVQHREHEERPVYTSSGSHTQVVHSGPKETLTRPSTHYEAPHLYQQNTTRIYNRDQITSTTPIPHYVHTVLPKVNVQGYRQNNTRPPLLPYDPHKQINPGIKTVTKTHFNQTYNPWHPGSGTPSKMKNRPDCIPRRPSSRQNYDGYYNPNRQEPVYCDEITTHRDPVKYVITTPHPTRAPPPVAPIPIAQTTASILHSRSTTPLPVASPLVVVVTPPAANYYTTPLPSVIAKSSNVMKIPPRNAQSNPLRPEVAETLGKIIEMMYFGKKFDVNISEPHSFDINEEVEQLELTNNNREIKRKHKKYPEAPLEVLPLNKIKPNYKEKSPAACSDGHFKCDGDKCITLSKICNKIQDCEDGTDEEQCEERIGYEIRLTDSNKTNEGRIEVKAFGVWGFICDDKFGLRDADVICKELGFKLGAAQARYLGPLRRGPANETIFLMDDLECLGNETSVRECQFNGWGVHDCLPEEAAGVVCRTPAVTCPKDFWLCSSNDECIPTSFLCDNVKDCADGSDESDQICNEDIEVRLAGGASKLEGRVEVKFRGIWGTVCDDDFTDKAAKVVCRMLGFKGPARAKKEGFYGQGTGQIWLDQVACFGNESSITQCMHWQWGENNCGHSEDVGVVCSNFTDSEENKHNRGRELSVADEDDSTLDFVDDNFLKDSGEILPEVCGTRIKHKKTREEQDEEDGIAFRVVRGSLAKIGDYPWQASLRVRGPAQSAHWCGAVLISKYHLLTAAHCLVAFSKGAYFVRVGDHQSVELEVYIERFYVHEDFRKGQHMNNDIALIKLKPDGVPLGKWIRPICLPPKDAEYTPGKNCTISGWGSIQTGKSTPSNQLRAGWVPLQSMEVCRMPQVYGGNIMEGMVCAGELDEGVDACDGDSGGPLACMHDGVFSLYGITSWGQHCGHANKPGVYVKVAHYRDWIDKKIKLSMTDK